jgi:glycosyltransferase involved in cell wall biosynthesis
MLCRENAGEVAEKIIDVLTNEEKYNLFKENTEKRRKLFDWDLIAERVKKVYESTLAGS